MKKLLLSLLAIGSLVLTGCSFNNYQSNQNEPEIIIPDEPYTPTPEEEVIWEYEHIININYDIDKTFGATFGECGYGNTGNPYYGRFIINQHQPTRVIANNSELKIYCDLSNYQSYIDRFKGFGSNWGDVNGTKPHWVAQHYYHYHLYILKDNLSIPIWNNRDYYFPIYILGDEVLFMENDEGILVKNPNLWLLRMLYTSTYWASETNINTKCILYFNPQS